MAKIPKNQLELRKKVEESFSKNGLISIFNTKWEEFGLGIEIEEKKSKDIFLELKENPSFDFDMLLDVTVVDWLKIKENRYSVIYQLLSISKNHRLEVKIEVSNETCSVCSLSDIYKSALFMEREAWDMYGVRFKGHPDLRRVLLYDEFKGHPLRKDYPIKKTQPRLPLRIPELRNESMDMKRKEFIGSLKNQNQQKVS